MAQKLYEESSIQAIANAIRSKNGTTDTYKTSEMADAILVLDGGNAGGYNIPEEAFTISGRSSYRFAFGNWDWFIEKYGNQITTSKLIQTDYMFWQSKLTNIPFDFNFQNGGADVSNMFYAMPKITSIPSIDFKQDTSTTKRTFTNMFKTCYKLQEIGTLKNLYPGDMSGMFDSCSNLKYLPDFENVNWSQVHTYAYVSINGMFNCCHSLRSIPEGFLKELYGCMATPYNCVFYSAFQNCYVLDEVVGLNPQTGTLTSNGFSSTFSHSHRLKNIIFVMQDNGTPYTANWKNQSIDLTNHIGYGISTSPTEIVNEYSGITADKEVKDAATYQALKDDPDWFTFDINYSRYNHDSAVNTINSLPDTSAYLASAGGTNVIRFKGNSGALTDGGAINTLTAEEVAVATAKGWTVYVDGAVFTGVTE